MKIRNQILILSILITILPSLYSQESLKSIEEEYYDFLSLTGVTERPTLGYRTLSDNVWKFKEVETFEENEDGTFTKVRVPGKESDAHIWKNNNLGTTYTLWEALAPADNWFTRGIKQGFTARIYGPEWFNSYNTAAPYGQNDGALWQGRGYNTSLTAGVRLEGYGFELTFKPQVCFSQNLDFDILKSNYDSPFGYFRGYKHNIGIDAPQRFGNSSFWNYDWGDSEVRYILYHFTIGFGTQIPWIGPSLFNPILHSNNAPSYPKFDIGLRKTKITIPYFDIYLGDIESRIWIGYLTESDFFDNDSTNNHNRINGFNFSYSPSFIKYFTIGITKICLSKWNNFNIKYLNPFYSENTGIGTSIGEDQKASIYFNYLNPKVGFEIFGEIGIDDYLQEGLFKGLLRYPFDTLLTTFGLKKSCTINSNLKLDFIFELSSMEQPRNRLAANTNYSFNFHHQISQGFTNKGQYIGSYLANGGNSQIFLIRIYYPKGFSEINFQRNNPDNTYSYSNHAGNYTYKSNTVLLINSSLFITNQLYITISGIFDYIINSYYYFEDEKIKIPSVDQYNFCLIFGGKYIF